jgi:hypothetical protein
MKKIILAAALIAGSIAQAQAWTYETDDGRTVSNIQADRDGAYCATITGAGAGSIWRTCMRSRGYITHSCVAWEWWNGQCS